jgi:hypothetical protein
VSEQTKAVVAVGVLAEALSALLAELLGGQRCSADTCWLIVGIVGSMGILQYLAVGFWRQSTAVDRDTLSRLVFKKIRKRFGK